MVVEKAGADGKVEAETVHLEPSETLGVARRRMSVSMGVTPEQMAMLMGVDASGADDDLTVGEVSNA